MKYYYSENYIQDGSLEGCGRIVIYGNAIMTAYTNTMDHNYLLRGLASRYHINRDEVINNAIRLYFKYEDGRVIISPRREIDSIAFNKDRAYYRDLIKKELK